MDKVSIQTRSRMMSKIRSKSALDKRLHGFLKSRKISHRMHPKIYGAPDALVFPDILVFVDGCFWHSCPKCGTTPKSRQEYWIPKLTRTQERDFRNTRKLRKQGWRVVREWEHRFLAEPNALIERLRALIR